MSTSSFQSLEKPGGYREMLRVAVPLVISTGSFTVMQFVDRIFLTRYSAEAIQAALPKCKVDYKPMSDAEKDALLVKKLRL